jgi:hypothetical protein
MGAWGFNILENDASADAYSEYVDYTNAKLSPKEAVAKLKQEFAEPLEDAEDAAYIWLGVAKAQWEYGHIDDKLIRRIEALATSDAHLSEWDDAGPRGRQKRQKVLEGFAAKLRSKNPKPKQPRNAKLRATIYEPGTCLAIARDDGQYLAALVLFDLLENPGPGQDTFGINTVALLDYLSKKPPALDVFENRNFVREEEVVGGKIKAWLPVVRQCFANFHRRSKDKLTVVGQIKLTRADILEASTLTWWHLPDAERLMDAWKVNRKRKDLKLALRINELPEYRKWRKEVDDILREGNPKRPPSKTLEDQLDLSPLGSV